MVPHVQGKDFMPTILGPCAHVYLDPKASFPEIFVVYVYGIPKI